MVSPLFTYNNVNILTQYMFYVYKRFLIFAHMLSPIPPAPPHPAYKQSIFWWCLRYPDGVVPVMDLNTRLK